MTWYKFSQNNSGGKWRYDEERGISAKVFIEADTADLANVHANYIGIYFDGCHNDIDCNCCGDRWYPVEDTSWNVMDESDVPEPDSAFTNDMMWKWMKGYEFFVHPLEGDFYGAGV